MTGVQTCASSDLGINQNYPEFNDDKGISLIFINTRKGNIFYNRLSINKIETTYQEAINNNPSFESSVDIPKQREYFWIEYKRINVSAINKTHKKMQTSLRLKIIIKFKKILKRLSNRTELLYKKYS